MAVFTVLLPVSRLILLPSGQVSLIAVILLEHKSVVDFAVNVKSQSRSLCTSTFCHNIAGDDQLDHRLCC